MKIGHPPPAPTSSWPRTRASPPLVGLHRGSPLSSPPQLERRCLGNPPPPAAPRLGKRVEQVAHQDGVLSSRRPRDEPAPPSFHPGLPCVGLAASRLEAKTPSLLPRTSPSTRRAANKPAYSAARPMGMTSRQREEWKFGEPGARDGWRRLSIGLASSTASHMHLESHRPSASPQPTGRLCSSPQRRPVPSHPSAAHPLAIGRRGLGLRGLGTDSGASLIRLRPPDPALFQLPRGRPGPRPWPISPSPPPPSPRPSQPCVKGGRAPPLEPARQQRPPPPRGRQSALLFSAPSSGSLVSLASSSPPVPPSGCHVAVLAFPREAF